MKLMLSVTVIIFGNAVVVGCWCVWGEVLICKWPRWCHCHSLSLASVKSWLVTFLVLDHPSNAGQRPESRKTDVCCVCDRY